LIDLRLPLEQDVVSADLRHSFGVLSDEELASMLGVTTTTTAIWRSKKFGPKYIKLGRNVFYRFVDVLTWIENAELKSGQKDTA